MKRAVFLCLMVVILVSVFTTAGMTQGTTGAASGEQLFKEQCSACHPNGGNVINPHKPLKGSPKLKTFAAFLSWIRKPVQPMPPFPPSKIPDQQAKKLYDYILKQKKSEWK
jgi:cytochrome c6